MKGREEAWQKLETQAKRNQVYIRGYAPVLSSNVNSNDILSPGADGDNEIDLDYVKENSETREVGFNLTPIFCNKLPITLFHHTCFWPFVTITLAYSVMCIHFR